MSAENATGTRAATLIPTVILSTITPICVLMSPRLADAGKRSGLVVREFAPHRDRSQHERELLCEGDAPLPPGQVLAFAPERSPSGLARTLWDIMQMLAELMMASRLNHTQDTSLVGVSDSNGIAAPNDALANDGGVDADVRTIVLHNRLEDTRVGGQVVLGERGHHAAGAGRPDLQLHLIADG